ncbi:MAG: polysaccharide biosynthesis tyrosine autokinase [Cyclobacteriaceae bacterium]|nr:polysaccharide biosynthesis tyrosine autokinase [Cyclobacteriaceae bacterium]
MDIKSPNTTESIDVEKLSAVFRKNLLWFIIIFFATNLSAYLFIRYTKDLFESESELKLDIKRDATELGIKPMIEDQNLNIVSGEIEQIKSKLFFSKLIDSLDLSVSYYSAGKVLKDEMYKRSTFRVALSSINKFHYDTPIYFDFVNKNQYSILIDNPGKAKTTGTFGVPLEVDGTMLTIVKTKHFVENDGNDYYFVINSKASLIEYISKNIQVDPLNFNANTIRISFQDYNALKAHEIVNKIDSLYITYSNQQKNLANKQKIDWLNNELAQVETRMGGFEDYFENFTLKNKSSDLTLDLKRTIVAINKVDSQRYELNKKVIEINSLLEEIQSGKIATANQHYKFLPEYLNKRMEDLSKITHERDQLSLAYNENTFAFRQKEQELKTVQDLLFNQLLEIKKEWLTSLAELSKRKDQLEKEFAGMPDKNTQFTKNQRYYKLYEEFYLSMMQSKAEFEIAQAGSIPDFKILSSATLPIEPISPKRYLILGIGFVAGIVLNFFLLGILYVLNNKITSAKELETGTQIPLLGMIPVSRHSAESLFHVIDNPKSIVSEAIRTLRTNLEFFNTGTKSKVITITSTISGEGKSFLAMNLGGVLAMSRKKVVLIDLDMRKPKNEKYPAGNDLSKGMSTILIKKNTWTECVTKTSLENFDFIPSGPHPPNPSELLLNGEFTDVIEELRKAYDFVVIDTPPVGLVTDGIMAMKRSDLSIYVFRANYSKKAFMDNLLRVITINKLVHVSTVLNALPVNDRYYGYGYYEDRTGIKQNWKNLLRIR